MTATVARRPKGAERRAKIVEAAIAVIADAGLEAMSHRRVAAAAGVPLTATTYYFASLDELRDAAVNEIVDRNLSAMAARFERLPANSELAPTLAQLICDWLDNREASIVTVEIVASAMRRESVRKIAQSWHEVWIAAMTPRVGAARALVALSTASGFVQYCLLRDEQPSLDEVTKLMSRALGESD